MEEIINIKIKWRARKNRWNQDEAYLCSQTKIRLRYALVHQRYDVNGRAIGTRGHEVVRAEILKWDAARI